MTIDPIPVRPPPAPTVETLAAEYAARKRALRRQMRALTADFTARLAALIASTGTGTPA